METTQKKIIELEFRLDNLDERVVDVDSRMTQIEPAVIQASNKNVVVYISVVITIINLLLLLLK